MDKLKKHSTSSLIAFKELPAELSSLFVKRTITNIVIILVMITCCFFIRSNEIWLIILLVSAVLIFLNTYLFIQLRKGDFYILEAVCEKITSSSFRLYNSETKVELVLKNDDYYYTLNVSKHIAKSLTEGMKVRVYVFKNNAYQKSEGQIVIISPLLITPIV